MVGCAPAMIVKDALEGFIEATLVKSDKTSRFYIVSSITSHLRTVVFKSNESGEVLEPRYFKEPNPVSHREAIERWSKGLGKEDFFALAKETPPKGTGSGQASPSSSN